MPWPRPKLISKTQRDPDTDFNSIHFGIEIIKCFKSVLSIYSKLKTQSEKLNKFDTQNQNPNPNI
jgi:hypothetical protein